MKIKPKHFELAYLRLTGFYVLIIMTISVSFSFALYKIYNQEMDRGLVRQTRFLRDTQMMDSPNDNPFPNLDNLRNQVASESMGKLTTDLIYFNILILIASAFLSYFFAKKTLYPIEKSVEEQNRFTADASHELRTPLAAIRSEIEVNLRDKNFSLNDAKGILKSNLEEVEKLESLSNSLLKLARADDQVNFDLEQVNLEGAIVEAYEKVSKLADGKEILFDNTFQKLNVWADKQSLIEVLVILMDNAIKYSPDKSKIKITTFRKDGHAIIAIEDHGMGIKSSDLPYIFNRFYRADHSRCKEKIGGYGLGLSIAKQLVDLNKGSILVESTPGKGTIFTLGFRVVDPNKKHLFPLSKI